MRRRESPYPHAVLDRFSFREMVRPRFMIKGACRQNRDVVPLRQPFRRDSTKCFGPTSTIALDHEGNALALAHVYRAGPCQVDTVSEIKVASRASMASDRKMET